MRTIKFRAWIKNQKRMVNWEGLDGVNEYLTEMIKDIEVELMQFTGLLDKNGKEIYEGDICRWGKFTEEINYNSGSFCFGGGLLALIHIQELEVLGNVFENPELLGGKE